ARLQRRRERFVPRKIVVVWIDHTNKSQMMATMRPSISFDLNPQWTLSPTTISGTLPYFVVHGDEDHLVDVFAGEELSRCIKGNLCCFRNRITIGSATDRGKGNRVDSVLDVQLGDVAAAESDLRFRIFHFTARAVRSANCRQSAVCNENGRGVDSGDPARIPLYRVLVDNHPSAAAGEWAYRHTVRSSLPCVHPTR